MDPCFSNRINILDIYRKYCDITSRNASSSRLMVQSLVTKLMDSRETISDTSVIIDDLSKLMGHLDLTVNSRQFTCFYDFVFFFCRDCGKKRITVDRAVAAWKLVLKGRFRLLTQWCDFVENNQHHNISEDTWQQVLAFSRSIHEDLEGYDPQGAWPVLIDDFVEYMYRISQSTKCRSPNRMYDLGFNVEPQACIVENLQGLNLLPGSKRKSLVDLVSHELEEWDPISNVSSSNHFGKHKKFRLDFVHDELKQWDVALALNDTDEMETNKRNPFEFCTELSCHVGSMGIH